MRLMKHFVFASLFCLALAARADLIKFEQTGSQPVTFYIDSNTTPVSRYVSSAVRTALYDTNGVLHFFYEQPNYGGGYQSYTTDSTDTLVLNTAVYSGVQIYSGSESAPTFTPGSYVLLNGNTHQNDTLYISLTSSTAATPEPSSLLLLLTGVAGTGSVLRRRLSR